MSEADGPVSAADDFAGYVAARWPELVRTVVLLGCPEQIAADVALDALARCQRDWARTRRDADVDGLVRGELVAAWDRRRVGRDPWWRETTPAAPAAPVEAAAVAEVVADELDRLPQRRRTALVLDQLVGATGGRGEDGSPVVAAARLRAAAGSVSVLAPPARKQITARRRVDGRRRVRRGLRIGLGVALPLVVVAAGLTWLADRDAPSTTTRALAPLRVTAAKNPTNVVWEAAGVLHLARGTVPVPPLRQVAPFGTGVVYADRAGRVVRLDDDGTRTTLGREEADLGFVSSDSRGWVAWVDPTRDRPLLVVADAVAGRVIGRLTVSADTRPVAIDGDTVYLSDDVGVRGWQPLRAERPDDAVEPADMVTTRARTRVYQVGDTELRLSPYDGVNLSVIGTGGRLSRDGGLLATRTSGAAGGDGPVAIYDTTTGDALQTGVAADELALDVTLGPDQSVTYLIARKADRPNGGDELRASFAGALQLRTCRLFLADVPPQCSLITDIPVSGVIPLLAH